MVSSERLTGQDGGDLDLELHGNVNSLDIWKVHILTTYPRHSIRRPMYTRMMITLR